MTQPLTIVYSLSLSLSLSLFLCVMCVRLHPAGTYSSGVLTPQSVNSQQASTASPGLSPLSPLSPRWQRPALTMSVIYHWGRFLKTILNPKLFLSIENPMIVLSWWWMSLSLVFWDLRFFWRRPLGLVWVKCWSVLLWAVVGPSFYNNTPEIVTAGCLYVTRGDSWCLILESAAFCLWWNRTQTTVLVHMCVVIW